GGMCSFAKVGSSRCGRKGRISSAPEKTQRNPVCEKRALPPNSGSGAFSSMTTLGAPAWLAATAASKAALPPPTTTTGMFSVRTAQNLRPEEKSNFLTTVDTKGTKLGIFFWFLRPLWLQSAWLAKTSEDAPQSARRTQSQR